MIAIYYSAAFLFLLVYPMANERARYLALWFVELANIFVLESEYGLPIACHYEGMGVSF